MTSVTDIIKFNFSQNQNFSFVLDYNDVIILDECQQPDKSN